MNERFGNYKVNFRNRADGLDLMSAIADGTIAAAFYDPQYRGVLDRLQYGNEGSRQGERCNLPQMDEDMIKRFICEIDRVLKPSGHLFLWIDKFHLLEGFQLWLTDTDLHIVDMITWDKGKIGMGYRTRRRSEYLIVLQKAPVRAKGIWTDHAIPDVWQEKVEKVHAHSKPIELQMRLILATTQPGDYVLDPAAGGYSVLDACRQCGRDCITGDILYGDDISAYLYQLC